MARSFKKVPIGGNCGWSDRFGKSKANRRLRRMVRENVMADIFPVLREVSNVYDFAKDGKRYDHDHAARSYRK